MVEHRLNKMLTQVLKLECGGHDLKRTTNADTVPQLETWHLSLSVENGGQIFAFEMGDDGNANSAEQKVERTEAINIFFNDIANASD